MCHGRAVLVIHIVEKTIASLENTFVSWSFFARLQISYLYSAHGTTMASAIPACAASAVLAASGTIPEGSTIVKGYVRVRKCWMCGVTAPYSMVPPGCTQI